MAGLCRNPCQLVTSLTPHSSPLLSCSPSPASASSASPSSSSSSSSCPPILCSSRRSKKRAAKAKSLPPSTRQQQQASRKLEHDSDSDDILLGIGAGASTITALQPRADHDEDDDPAWQQREQLRLRIAQQQLLQSYNSSPGISTPRESDPLSRYALAGHETSLDTTDNKKQLALADGEEVLGVNNGSADENKTNNQPMSRHALAGYETSSETTNNKKQVVLADEEEEVLDAKNGSADGNEEELEDDEEESEGDHLQYEWVEVNAEDEQYEDENEEDEQEEYVEFWEGDLGPMTEEEEAELLLQAEMELAELEKEKKPRKSPSPISHHVEETDAEEDCSDEEALLLQEADAELAKLESSSKQLNDRNIAQTIRTATSPKSSFSKASEVTDSQEPQQLDDMEDEDAFIARVTKEIEAEERRKGKVLDDGERSQRRAIPAVMRCFDRAKIFVKAGNGGNGVVAFRREKFVPFGGPSGGSGGRGGHVYVEADASVNSLLSFRKSVHFRAGRGAHGQGKSQDGAAGEDCTVKVPLGTVIREADNELSGSGKILLELTRPGQVELLLPGGRGGRGNAAFKTGRNKTPQLAENGEVGAEMWLELELKLVADVGIIGVPNAGKSTLLSAISAAQPAIANYPFTTLLPNLGVVSMGFEATMVFADLPGLLEGAHLGIGLGHEFLRHTERCRVLVHMVDGMSQQPEQEYEAVRLELELFNPSLSEKPFIVAFNKMDIPEVAERWEKFQRYMKERGIEPLCISAATMKGTAEVVNRAYAMLQSLPCPSVVIPEDEDLQVGEKVRRQRSAPIEQFEIVGDSKARTWEVRGVGLERFVQMTNWEYFEALTRFQHVLTASGVNKALKAQGVSEGDTVIVGEMEFEWHDSENVLAGDWRRGFRGSRLWPH